MAFCIRMLAFIAVAFALYITFFIGWNVGKGVPDEIAPSRKYLSYGIDVLLFAMLIILTWSFGWPALVIVIALFILRYFFSFVHVYAPLSGALLGTSAVLPTNTTITLALLCLTMNFLIGATSDMTQLMRNILQPIVAVALLIIASKPI
jgi:hypothetical protein